MSKALQKMLAFIRRDAISMVRSHAFERMRTEHPELQGYADVASILEALASRRLQYASRDDITRALIAGRQQSHDTLSIAMLIAAYSPMLVRMRVCATTPLVRDEDLDQLLLIAFLEAVGSYDTRKPGPVAVQLKRQTERLFGASVRREREERERELCLNPAPENNDGLYLLESDYVTCVPDFRRQETLLSLAEATERAAQTDGVKLVVCTVLRDESLMSRVPSELEGREHRRAYERLKRQRSRTLQRLRIFLDDNRRSQESPAANVKEHRHEQSA